MCEGISIPVKDKIVGAKSIKLNNSFLLLSINTPFGGLIIKGTFVPLW